jgi:hypothetical protein
MARRNVCATPFFEQAPSIREEIHGLTPAQKAIAIILTVADGIILSV